MNRYINKCLCTVLFVTLYSFGISQSPSFYHLTTSNGLYDNHVRSLAIDKHGILWIGTEEGLNMYNGHSTELFLKTKQAEMPADNINYLLCDSKNRIWLASNEGSAWIDNRRKVHRVVFPGAIQNFRIKGIIETAKFGIVIISNPASLY